MSPRTNSTFVLEPVTITMPDSVSLPAPLEQLVTVRSSAGLLVPATVQSASTSYVHSVTVSGFGEPGWYTIQVAMNPNDVENNDRSMVRDSSGFHGELLIGASDPGVAEIVARGLGADASFASVRWSEPVLFAEDPATALQLRSPAGALIPCTSVTEWDAGAGATWTANLSCPTVEQPGYLVVMNPPRAPDGGVASFPLAGVPWALAGPWTSTASLAQVWQPSVMRRTHESFASPYQGSSYEKCVYREGCACGSSGTGLPLGLALLVAWWASRRSARRAS